jgi:hypothetical protein
MDNHNSGGFALDHPGSLVVPVPETKEITWSNWSIRGRKIIKIDPALSMECTPGSGVWLGMDAINSDGKCKMGYPDKQPNLTLNCCNPRN